MERSILNPSHVVLGGTRVGLSVFSCLTTIFLFFFILIRTMWLSFNSHKDSQEMQLSFTTHEQEHVIPLVGPGAETGSLSAKKKNPIFLVHSEIFFKNWFFLELSTI